MSIATPANEGWLVSVERVEELKTLFARLRDRAGDAPVAFGVDAPIGLPGVYKRPHDDFPAFLRSLKRNDPFFEVNNGAETISVDRPFYPQSSKAGSRKHHLLSGLKLSDGAMLLRECERPLDSTQGASSIFWTLGANQAGKAAICLWRDLLLEALTGTNPPSLWPFDGSIAKLLQPGRIVVAETYPANAMHQMGLRLNGTKRSQSNRQAIAEDLKRLLANERAELDPDLAGSIDDGFGPKENGEDPFDSLIGLVRMLQVIRNPVLDTLPEVEIRHWEGWILGRPLSTS